MSFSLSSRLYCLYPTCVSAKCAIRTMLLLGLLSFQETFQLASKPLALILRRLSTGLLYRQLHLTNNIYVAAAFPSPTFLHHDHNRSPSHLTHKHSLTRVKTSTIIQRTL